MTSYDGYQVEDLIDHFGFSKQEGCRYLGGFIGDSESRE